MCRAAAKTASPSTLSASHTKPVTKRLHVLRRPPAVRRAERVQIGANAGVRNILARRTSRYSSSSPRLYFWSSGRMHPRCCNRKAALFIGGQGNAAAVLQARSPPVEPPRVEPRGARRQEPVRLLHDHARAVGVRARCRSTRCPTALRRSIASSPRSSRPSLLVQAKARP